MRRRLEYKAPSEIEIAHNTWNHESIRIAQQRNVRFYLSRLHEGLGTRLEEGDLSPDGTKTPLRTSVNHGALES